MAKTSHSKDPRKIITPYAFEVYEPLLGRPLARPSRRLLALLADCAIAAALTLLGGLILGIIASLLFFLLALRGSKQHFLSKSGRMIFAGIAAVIVFTTVLTNIDSHKEAPDTDSTDQQVASQVDWGKYIGQAASVMQSDSTNKAEAFEAIGQQLENEIKRIRQDTAAAPAPPHNAAALLTSFARAYSLHDSLTVDSLRPQVAGIVAGHRLYDLQHKNRSLLSQSARLEAQNRQLQQQIENPGLLAYIRTLANDMGLAFGWLGIYFILSMAWLDGQTPGKKLFRLQVVRLDGKPLTLWPAFERFGGYAAGFATGLLGFAQIYWDANRQAIHDKIAGTVVVDLRRQRIPLKTKT